MTLGVSGQAGALSPPSLTPGQELVVQLNPLVVQLTLPVQWVVVKGRAAVQSLLDLMAVTAVALAYQ